MEDKLKEKLEAEDRDKVGAAIKEALEWLEENGEAEKEDYEEKLKEVQDVCGPIISKVGLTNVRMQRGWTQLGQLTSNGPACGTADGAADLGTTPSRIPPLQVYAQSGGADGGGEEDDLGDHDGERRGGMLCMRILQRRPGRHLVQ